MTVFSSKKVILLALVTGIMLSACQLSPAHQAPSPTPTITATTTTATSLTYACPAGQTAFAALQMTDRKVEFKQSSLGKLVTSIDGHAEGDNKYWQYQINGQDAQVGAEAYVCKAGDQITWELK